MCVAERLHDAAMDLAARARLADPESTLADALLAMALVKELAAVRAFKSRLEPSRAVLFRSAATLALRCRKHELAASLAAQGLAGNPPPGLIAELQAVARQAQAG